MRSTTPFLKPFGALLPGRLAVARVLKGCGLGELYDVFQTLVPVSLFARPSEGANSRRRTLPPQITFWAFLSQALSPGSACREVVRKLDAWWHWSGLNTPLSISESGYCQARKRLSQGTLELILRHVAAALERNVLQAELGTGRRPVKIVDGTMLSMPDTELNQRRWPQNAEQKPGLGFPQLKLVGVFSLESGALVDYAIGSLHDHESTLFRSLWSRLSPGDILLGDRAFCSYSTMAALRLREVDCVWRVHHARKIDFRQGTRLGHDDRLVTWVRPGQRPRGLPPESYAALPATLAVRMIRLIVQAPGLRPRAVTLVTTLLDPVAHPADTLRELYLRRWQVEGHFAQIKTTLGLDILRCKSPLMIEKELLIHLIAYNLVRAIMQQSAHHYHRPLGRISFKGSLDALRHFARPIHLARHQPRRVQMLIAQMLEIIACDAVPERPGRSEPRAKKRRPKTYHLLTSPRHQMKVRSHRNRPKATRA